MSPWPLPTTFDGRAIRESIVIFESLIDLIILASSSSPGLPNDSSFRMKNQLVATVSISLSFQGYFDIRPDSGRAVRIQFTLLMGSCTDKYCECWKRWRWYLVNHPS